MSSYSQVFFHCEPLVLFPTSSLSCDLCGCTVRVETAVTDEYGQAVHASCYLAALRASQKAA